MIDRPIQHSIVPKLHPAYYMMHKYWARKPHNVVRAYVEHYPRPGETVLDPFSGSGVTAIESLLLNRKAIAVDINPIACLILEATVAEVALPDLVEAFGAIEQRLRPYVDRLYATDCPECASTGTVTHAVWERTANCPNCGQVIGLATAKKVRGMYVCSNCGAASKITSRTIRDERMVEIWYSCANCGGARKKKPADFADQVRATQGLGNGVQEGIRNGKMFLSNRTLIHEGMSVASFFTVRNQQILSLILQEIRSVSESHIRRFLEFVFTSSVAQASRLIPYREGLTSGGPAWTVSGFWIPNLHFELNAWNCFQTRFKKALKGKQQLDEQFQARSVGRNVVVDSSQRGYDLAIFNRSSTDLGRFVAPDSVDYIFADPPYGDSVPYLEYSTLWSSWLGHQVDFENEIVVSNSSERNKDIENYRELMRQAFAECYRVLKAGRWLSLTFHNRDMEVWDAIVSAASDAGFEFVNCVYQVPAVISAKAQLSRSGSTTGDIILNFRKLENVSTFQSMSQTYDLEEIVVSEAERVVGERGGVATTDEILRAVILKLLKLHIKGVHQRDIQQILRANFVGSNGIWKFRPEDIGKIERYESIETMIAQIISACFERGTYEFKDVLVEVFSKLTEGRTPGVKLVFSVYQKMLTE